MNRITLNIKDKKISNYENLFFSFQKLIVSLILLVLAKSLLLNLNLQFVDNNWVYYFIEII